ncbi:MAG: S8 family peptidase [Terriglobales bacterium]
MRSKTSLIVVVLALVAVAAAGTQKLAPELQNRRDSGNIDVIVQFHSPLTAQHHRMVASHGGKLKTELVVVKSAVYSIPASSLKDLARNPEVAYISPDRPVRGMGTASTSTVTLDYHTDTANAPYAWGTGLDGSGIGVAIIDSGILDMPDLHVTGLLGAFESRIVYNQNFVTPYFFQYADQFGHGTHVAGIVGGNGNKSTGSPNFYTFKGVAPNVNLVNLRVLDQNGQGTDSGVISAIQTAIVLRYTYNIRVINLSLGRPVFESYTLDPLCQAVEAAYRAGIVVVVAAGNDGRDNSAGTNGYGTIYAPGSDPYVITVGAMKTMATPTRTDDLIATYSSKGPTAIDHIAKPDLVAPGNDVISLYSSSFSLAQLYPANEVPHSVYQTSGGSSLSSTYFVLSGTSMATPMVSGAAALMLQQNPALTPDQVKATLMLTASKTFPQYSSYTDPTSGATYNDQYDVFTVGAGYLDIHAALQDTALSTGVAFSPVVTYDPTSQNVYFVNNTFAVWGGSSNWSTFAVWGGNAFNASQFAVWGGSNPYSSFAVWGGSAPWGNNTTNGFFAVWGGSSVASNSTQYSETLVTGEN